MNDMFGKVYLAGSIVDKTYDEATLWRDYVYRELLPYKIYCYSPMRGKQRTTNIPKHPLTTPSAIMARDYYDCTTANLIIVNALGMDTLSTGTAIEVGWAYMGRIPTIFVSELSSKLLLHPMLDMACDFRVLSLNDAIEVTKDVLLPNR